MKNKTLFSFLLLASSATCVGLVFSKGTSSIRGNASCSHNGYHYDAIEATPYMEGSKEFWRCCTCHELFYDCEAPSGNWITRSVDEAVGGLPEEVILNKTSDVIIADNAVMMSGSEDTSNINIAAGYSKSTKVNGCWSASYTGVSSAYLAQYTTIKFSLGIDSTSAGYFEVYAKNDSGTYSQAFAKNASGNYEIKLVLENDEYRLYCNGNWTAYSYAKNSFTSDCIKVQLADSAVFYISEMIGTVNTSYSEKIVSNKVVESSTYSTRYHSSTLSVGGHHSFYSFSDVSLEDYSYLYFFVKSSVDGYFFITGDTNQGDTSIKKDSSNLFELVKSNDKWNVYYNGSILTNYDGTLPASDLDISNLSSLSFMANATCVGNPFTFSPLYYATPLAIYNQTNYSIVYHDDETSTYADFASEMATTFTNATGATITASYIDSMESYSSVNAHPFSDESLTKTTDTGYVLSGYSYSSIITKSWTATPNTYLYSLDESLYTNLKFCIRGTGESTGEYFELQDAAGSTDYFAFCTSSSEWQEIEFKKSGSSWDIYANNSKVATVSSIVNDIAFKVNGTYYVTPLVSVGVTEPVIGDNEYKIVIGEKLASNKGLDNSELNDSEYKIQYIGNSIYIYGGSHLGTKLGMTRFLEEYFDYEYYCPGVYTNKTISKVYSTGENINSSNYFANWYNVDGNLRFGDDYTSYNNHVGTTPSYTDASLVFSTHNENAYISSSYFSGSTNNNHIDLTDSSNITGVANFLYNKYVVGSGNTYDKLCFSLNDDNTWYSSVSSTSEYSNTYWAFINSVAETLDSMVDYDITLYGLAYHKTILTPTTDGFSFYQGSHVKVSVWYAPVEANWYKPLNDSVNQASDFTCDDVTYSPYSTYLAWSNLCANKVKMGLFSYSTFTDSYFAPFDSINSMQTNYQFAYEHNTGFIYDMGQYDNEVETDWSALKIYLKYKLSINPYANVTTLIENFCNNYFGAAGSKMISLLNAERSLLGACYTSNSQTSETLKYGAISAGKISMQYNYWNSNKSSFLDLFDTIDEAYELVSGDETLTNRIKLEALSIRYVYMRCCTLNYDSAKIYEKWINSRGESFSSIQSDAIALGVTHMSESTSFGTLS